MSNYGNIVQWMIRKALCGDNPACPSDPLADPQRLIEWPTGSKALQAYYNNALWCQNVINLIPGMSIVWITDIIHCFSFNSRSVIGNEMLFDGYSSKMSVGINIILMYEYNLNQNPYGKDKDFIRPLLILL